MKRANTIINTRLIQEGILDIDQMPVPRPKMSFIHVERDIYRCIETGVLMEYDAIKKMCELSPPTDFLIYADSETWTRSGVKEIFLYYYDLALSKTDSELHYSLSVLNKTN